MKRSMLLLTILAVVLTGLLWYLLLWSPASEELTATEDRIAVAQDSQASAATRIAALRLVREQAPALQTELTAAEAIIPRDNDLPSALRQFQLAADESGAVLVSVAPSRPVPVGDPAAQLYAMDLLLELRGSYFQIVDTLRRLEDPEISPRGLIWNNLAMTVDEYPELTVSLGGQMFTSPPEAPIDPTAPVDPAVQAPAADAPAGDVPADEAPADEAPQPPPPPSDTEQIQ